MVNIMLIMQKIFHIIQNVYVMPTIILCSKYSTCAFFWKTWKIALFYENWQKKAGVDKFAMLINIYEKKNEISRMFDEAEIREVFGIFEY
jgi:hypothetical protein